MKSTSVRARTLACALLAGTALCGLAAAPAQAQSGTPSVHQNIDGNGVDLTDGSFNFQLTEGSIGAGASSLSLVRTYGLAGWTDGMPGRLHRSLFTGNNKIS